MDIFRSLSATLLALFSDYENSTLTVVNSDA